MLLGFEGGSLLFVGGLLPHLEVVFFILHFRGSRFNYIREAFGVVTPDQFVFYPI